MNRILLEQALLESEALRVRYPEIPTIASIINQLEYLLELDVGSADESRVPDIILGVQAAREIESLDMQLANKLFEISAEVDLIKVR